MNNYIVIVGTVVDGLEFFGPFNLDGAVEYGDKYP